MKRFSLFVLVCAVLTACATPTPTATPAAIIPILPTFTPQPVVSTPTATAPTVPQSQVGWRPDGTVSQGEYAHQVAAGGVTFYWRNDAQFLYGALTAKTKGWVSVGFDPGDRMQAANYILGYVQDGQVLVYDMWGTRPTGSGSHPADESLGGKNDIVESGGSEQDGVTVIEFKIPLDSGDAYDKPLFSGKSYTVILAQGGRDGADSMHSDRGYARVGVE